MCHFFLCFCVANELFRPWPAFIGCLSINSIQFKEPLFHVVSYSSNELSLVDDWASTFSQLHLLKRHCFFCTLSQNRMLSRRNSKAFYSSYINSKFCAFGSVVLLSCSVSDKFFSSFKTSAISAKFLAKLVVHNLESNP